MDSPTFADTQLQGLTPEQREAVTSHSRRLLVQASAGSGKTHVLTLRIQRRVAEGEIESEHVLAMTFTRKAGDELRQRLYKAGIRDVEAGTFHRAALKIVTQFREDNHLAPFTIESHRRRLVLVLVAQLNETEATRIEEWQIPRLEQELAWSLSQGLTGVTYGGAVRSTRRDTPLPARAFSDFLDRYVGLCRSRSVLDFDLLLIEATNLLRDHPAVLAAFRHRHRALFVDEAQDMNPLQFKLLQQMAGDDPDLFCVGDKNQSIYGFNGASPSLLEEIPRTWDHVTMLDLTRNHRSTALIITVANTLLEEGAVGITPAREEGEMPLVRAYDTDEEEATHVASWLRSRFQPGSPWKSMAVLARTNAQLTAIETALTAAAIPVERRGAEHSPASDIIGESPARWTQPDVPNAVALSTIHRAKGLEWQHVAVVGWAEGVLPSFQAHAASQLAEEQRLAYVALTRAETTLLLTWSRGTQDPRRPPRTASRFLGPILAAIAAESARLSPLPAEQVSERIASMKAKLRAALDAHENENENEA